MIKEVTLKDKEVFYKLGTLLKDNFKELFNLEKILEQDYSNILGYYINDTLIAFLHIEKSYDEINIINIVVFEEYQRQKIATKLLDNLFKRYDDVTKYNLEVKVTNDKAINLYKKFDFKPINIRKNYYEGIDGYLMIKEVKK